MLEIKVSSSNRELSEFADIALKNRLYVSGWHLSYFLRELRDKNNKTEDIDFDKENRCVILFRDGKPLGVGIFFHYSYNGKPNIQIFIRKSERKKRYGSMIIEELFKKVNAKKEDVVYRQGVKGSLAFYYKVLY